MKVRILQLAAASFIVAGSAWISSSAGPQPATAVDYSFREAPLNSLGIKSLKDLRGKPIVIDFWGKN